MFAHIDADILVYRCGFAAERNRWYAGFDWNGEGWDTIIEFEYKREAEEYIDKRLPNVMTRTARDFELWSERHCEPVENALHNVKSVIETIVEVLQPDDFCLYLSGSDNFREEIAKTRIYKGNRDPSHQPTHKDAIKRYMQKYYDCRISEGEEADDLLAYTHYTMWKEDPFSTVIVTTDKDLDMIPGLHYNFVRDERYDISPEEGERNFWRQCLTGDSTDNIPGLKGVGPQKAKKLIDHLPLSEVPYEVFMQYVSQCGENATTYLTEQGQLLWIRRKPGELWTPPEFEEAEYDEHNEISLY